MCVQHLHEKCDIGVRKIRINKMVHGMNGRFIDLHADPSSCRFYQVGLWILAADRGATRPDGAERRC
jgi:hypothetical protein